MYAWKKLLLDMDMFYYSIQVGLAAVAAAAVDQNKTP